MIRYQSLKNQFKEYRNSNLIYEAVIYPREYINNILEKIDNLYPSLQRKKYNLKQLCTDLNFHFKNNKIKFFADKEIDITNKKFFKYGINKGATLPDKFGTIGIYCNELSLNIFKSDKIFNKFKEVLTVCLKHELIHRGQVLKIKDTDIRYEVLKKNYDEDIIKYLSDKQEIMAFAWELTELLRIKGLKDKEILNLMQKDIPQLRRTSEIANVYFDYFSIKDAQIKLLYKYVYMYLD